jgi:hypothetical protein
LWKNCGKLFERWGFGRKLLGDLGVEKWESGDWGSEGVICGQK